MGVIKKVITDIKEDAAAQHQVTKANFEAAKMQGKASWEEAKLSPKEQAKKRNADRKAQISAANEKTAEAQARIDKTKEYKKG